MKRFSTNSLKVLNENTGEYEDFPTVGGNQASNIFYENENSGLAATNVQSALDIISGGLTEVNTGMGNKAPLVTFSITGGDNDTDLKAGLFGLWSTIANGNGMINFSNTEKAYTGYFNKVDSENGSIEFLSESGDARIWRIVENVVSMDMVALRSEVTTLSETVTEHGTSITELKSDLAYGVQVTDCNDAIDANVTYIASDTASNRPTNEALWYIIRPYKQTDNNLRQLAFTLSDDRIYSRRRMSGTWSNWIGPLATTSDLKEKALYFQTSNVYTLNNAHGFTEEKVNAIFNELAAKYTTLTRGIITVVNGYDYVGPFIFNPNGYLSLMVTSYSAVYRSYTITKHLSDGISIESFATKSDLAWKKAGEATGVASVSLPSSFTELSIIAYHTSSMTSRGFTFHLLREEVELHTRYNEGFYISNTSNGQFSMDVTLSTAKIINAYSGGADEASSYKIVVYYR